MVFLIIFNALSLSLSLSLDIYCHVGWGCRIHRLHLCKGVRPSIKCPGYNTKQSDGEVPVMLGLWGMQTISSLLPGSLWLGMVAPDRALSMG